MLEVSIDANPCGVPGRLFVGDSVHQGGEGRVYFSIDGRYAIKIYHQHRAGFDKRRLLESIIRLGQRIDEDDSSLAWPLALVEKMDGTPVVGCVTRRIPTPPFVPLGHVNNSGSTVVKWFRSGRDWSELLQVARGIARSVNALHHKGCAHADLSNRNFLVKSNEKGCDVILIDLDGMVVPGFLPPQVEGTMGIIAPEILAKTASAGELSDRHSLAVQVLQSLLFRNPFQPLITYDAANETLDEIIGWGSRAVFSEHPSDYRHRPRMLGLPLFSRGALSCKILPPALQRLTLRACVDGLHHPTKRPRASEWIEALSWCLDELYQCSRCKLRFPYPHWNSRPETRRCPFCGYRIEVRGYSVLWLYEPSGKGRYSVMQRHVVLASGWRLFADVLTPNTNPPMSRLESGVPSVAHVEWDSSAGGNRLVSDDDRPWTVLRGPSASPQRVIRGQSVALQPRTMIRFGEDGRLLMVKE